MDLFTGRAPRKKIAPAYCGRHFRTTAWFVLGVVRLLGGNPVDIRTGYANVGEFPIGEVG
jgi:hypothetical protein